jgi:hypothetical protein
MVALNDEYKAWSTYDEVIADGEACAAGIQAEIENADLYDGLLKMVDNPEVIRVFAALQRASPAKHLPAFERRAP